jgi:lipoprotein-anchoring transpeptidase ErfK/SrfK
MIYSRRSFLLRVTPALALSGIIAIACTDDRDDATPTTAPPTATRIPPTVTPAPTPIPALVAGSTITVGGVLRTRDEPNSNSGQIGTLGDQQAVQVVGTVQGENWLVGSQTWLSTPPPSWSYEWYQLSDGSFIYAPFVFILYEGETSPLAPVPNGVEKWIDVHLSEQVAWAMVGDQGVYEAAISSGDASFPTATGSFAVEPDGRVSVAHMTASQAGYSEGQAQYDVERVLFAQYFDRNGNALHLNYWRPHSVFGHTPTSHGCVGLELHEAQYLWLFAEPGTRVEIHH